MAMNYAYNFAQIDPNTNMCIAMVSTSDQSQGDEPNWVEIPVNDPEYICKYYNWNDGKFYYDAAYTQEYISPLL